MGLSLLSCAETIADGVTVKDFLCSCPPPGAAESGKSTLVKQMKIIHSHGFTRQELLTFKVATTDSRPLFGGGMVKGLRWRFLDLEVRSVLVCSFGSFLCAQGRIPQVYRG